MSFPFYQGRMLPFNAPQVDELALACDSNVLCVLPLYFETSEL